MSESTKAVFVSYAREDAEAARRIADALKAFEVEVWFDEAGLEGGDAWDQKIRRQIKECSLFIPIISAQTQARREAYFRLEWKLAEERTHLMAEGTSFLLPIAIDDTAEDMALVPESFRRTQWTKLPRGVPNTSFVDRVRALLTHQQSHPSASAAPVVSQPARSRKKWPLVAAGLVLAVGASVLFWSRKPAASPTADAVRPAPASLPAAAEKSIAVLPFTNMSEDKDSGYFADGVHEDVLTDLANVGGLMVISRTSVMQYRGTTKSLRQIAAELGVAYVLEGSLRRAGNKVRVTGQLIDARTDRHIWAKTFDRDLTDIFAIQGELATEIAAALQAAISPLEQATLAARPTASMAAYELFMRARFLREAEGDTRDVISEVVSLLENAVQLDPQFADAWAGLAFARMFTYRRDVGSAEQLARARKELDTASRLAPNSFRVLWVQRQFYYSLEQEEERAKASEQIARLYPNRAETRIIMASEAWFAARWREALVDLEQAVTLDPRGLDTLNFALFYQLALRRYEKAEALWRVISGVRPLTEEKRWRQAINRFSQTGSVELGDALMATYTSEALHNDRRTVAYAASWYYLKGDAAAVIRLWQESGSNWRYSNQSSGFDLLSVATCYLKLGQRELALPLIRKNLDSLQAQLESQPDNWQARGDLALTHALLGETDAANRQLAKAETIARDLKNLTYRVNLQMYMACTLAWLGRKAESTDLIAATINQPAVYEIWRVQALRRSVHWWPLQGDPRFEALLDDPKNNAPLF